MKKILLFLTLMLATVGMTMAQDVYYAGYYTNASGKKAAAVYKNGELLHQQTSTTYQYESTSVLYLNGNVYWSVNYKGADGTEDSYADVFKNGSVWLNSQSQGRCINKLFTGYGHVYSVGYYITDGVKKAVLWKNDGDEVYRTFGTGSYTSEATCGSACYEGGLAYFVAGGYQYTSSTAYHGVIWSGRYSSELYTLPANTAVYDLAVYDNNVYSVGYKLVGSNRVVTVWKNATELYTLTDGTSNALGLSISIDGGDIFVSGWEGSTLKVWRNQNLYFSNSVGTNSNLRAVCANADAVYFAESRNNQGRIYKDNTILYAPDNCAYLYGLYVTSAPCEDTYIHPLPFTEDFERGSDWACWTNIDLDDNNLGYASTWHRTGSGQTGNYPHSGGTEGSYACHSYHPSNSQEGWLVSPRLFLQPGRDATTLKFYSRCNYACGSVWISTGSSSTNTGAFTKLCDLPVNGTWAQQTVNLQQYQGQAVYIAFKYQNDGTNPTWWYIDDIEVTESWSPCTNLITSYPWTENFNSGSEPGYCWYNIDYDHTGDLKCWQWDASNQCAIHPYGQDNGIMQDGWMMLSKRLQLTAGKNYTLSFQSKTGSPSWYSSEGSSVWIAVDKTGTPDPADYTQIWAETDPSNDWKTVTLDLTAYAGHDVRIAFQYQGVYAHTWYVDDVTVTEALPEYTINVESNNTAMGTVTGGGTYTQGATCTITATPSGSYVFLKWMRDGSQVSTNASYTFVVNESATYTAVFGEPAVTYYTITTDVNPAGAGTVDGGDTYASGATAVLTATPNQGWQFSKWSDNNTDNPHSITVTGNANYTAYFTRTTHTLTVNASPAEGGTVTGGGTYEYGETVGLNATPNEGYEFLNWNDGITTAYRTVMVTQDATYTAYFIDTTTTVYTVTVIPADATMGSVTGGGTFPEGTTISIEAVPFGINVFSHWSDGSTSNPRTITVTEDITYIAYFETPTLYTITVTSQNPEMGSVNGGGSFPMGAEVTIQANPFGGYYFDGWTDNNYDNPRTITVSGDATYTARFSAQQTQTYMLTVTCNPSQGAVIGTGTYSPGAEVNVEAIPYEGFAFDRWNDGVTDNPRTVTVNSNLTLVAFFKGTGVDENGETVLNVYPNPAKESIRIEGLEPNAEVLFYNTLGMLVKQVNATADQEINVSDLASGLYLVRSGRQTLRFVKE